MNDRRNEGKKDIKERKKERKATTEMKKQV